MSSSPLSTLLDLSHELGREERALAILGEGNTSTRVSDTTFLVKASGSNLATLEKPGLTECRFADLLSLLEKKAVERCGESMRPCSLREWIEGQETFVEAVFHSCCLTLPTSISWVTRIQFR